MMNEPPVDHSDESASVASPVCLPLMACVDSPAFRLCAVCLVLFCGTLLLFSRAVGHSFLDCDDPDYVTGNVHVQAGLTWANVPWAFKSDTAANWFPLTWLSHMLDWQLFGNDPRGHHATNILWHALSAVIAFLALRRLTGAFWTSAVSAALFAWHPLRVESVAWVAERKDVLSGFFFFLTLLAYARYVEESKAQGPGPKVFYGLTLAAFALGLMSKPMLVTTPFVLLLLDWWPLRRFTIYDLRFTSFRLLVEKLPFVLLSAISCVVTYLAQKMGGAIVETVAFGDRLANAMVSVAAYLGKFFWPFNLAMGYPFPHHRPATTVAGATLLILAITGMALWQWRRRPWLLTGWLWFLGMLVPVIGLVQVGTQAMADRYTYLPILGLQLALLWTLREWSLPSAGQWLRPAVVVLVLAGCAVRTWNQLAVWQNSRTLYEHALAVTKDNYLADTYLGTTLLNQNLPDEARLHFQRAVESKPDHAVARLRLGFALEKLGRENEALAAYDELLKFKPDDPEAQFHCANVLARMGRNGEALPHYERAIRLRPDFEPAECNYADSLRALNRPADAGAHYRRAIQLQPGDAGAYFGLGMAAEDSGRTDEALNGYRKAVELKPELADAQYNLGVLLLNGNRAAEAITHFRAAVECRTNYAAAYVGRGLAEAQLNQTPEAVRDLESAQQLDPNISGVSETLAQLREKLAAGHNGDKQP
jgi:protein O-mannosyl-transferase